MIEAGEDRSLQLPDGRTLGYAVYGAPDGRPVLYCTGGNSSRLEGRWFDARARERGVRLVVPDRPGFGLSDFQPGRTLRDWPDDVCAMADALAIDRFPLFGLSGGGAHAAAVLHDAPDRVPRAAIVSGLAPPEMPRRYAGMWLPVRVLFFLARWTPTLHALALRRMAAFYADAESMRARMLRALPEPDRALIEASPGVIDVFSDAAREAHRSSLEGDAWEWQLYVRPWDFSLESIEVPVQLWYGRVDRNAPVGMGRYLAGRIPGARLHEVDDGGHFSTIHNHIDAIFDHLLGD